MTYFTSLLFGFILYFCLWHSGLALQQQMKSLHIKSLGKIVNKDFVAVAVGTGFYVGIILLFMYVQETNYIMMFFIALSVISIPHIIIIDRIYI